MASPPSLQRRTRRIRVIIAAFAVSAIVVPAIAVGAVAATAGPRSHLTGAPPIDDQNMMRIAMNQVRVQNNLRLLHDKARRAAKPLTPAEMARASRDLERKVLTDNVYVRPVPGPVTQWYNPHPGLDIAPPYGTPIGAAHSGIVTFVGWEDGYGMHVEVTQADGYVTTYSHMSAFSVKVGQLVVAGQQLGNVGSTGYSTGPHLHFEVHMPNGQRMDPAVWLFEHKVIP